jgi:hypothetical protein
MLKIPVPGIGVLLTALQPFAHPVATKSVPGHGPFYQPYLHIQGGVDTGIVSLGELLCDSHLLSPW